MTDPQLDDYRLGVTDRLARIETKLDVLVTSKDEQAARLVNIETRVNRAGGIAAAALAILPFFADKIKALFIG